ncbi:unnamed protein product [Ceratitis capitata]|uniref:(Mediterranean fruit fly) hypothetical protein n=1 Tax=Ceratitis capitata TaxID=7213 RepID=A0A811VEP7_CERCA|nr:unnamed protein product [Ceratitis capitata]
MRKSKSVLTVIEFLEPSRVTCKFLLSDLSYLQESYEKVELKSLSKIKDQSTVNSLCQRLVKLFAGTWRLLGWLTKAYLTENHSEPNAAQIQLQIKLKLPHFSRITSHLKSRNFPEARNSKLIALTGTITHENATPTCITRYLPTQPRRLHLNICQTNSLCRSRDSQKRINSSQCQRKCPQAALSALPGSQVPITEAETIQLFADEALSRNGGQ